MEMNQMKDQELVDLFLSGDQLSIETLIERHKSKVYTYILLLVKNQELAEDIFQDTFIKVIKSLNKGKYQEKGIFLSWVMRIAHNLVIDFYRKAKHMKTISNDKKELNLLNSKKFAEQSIEDLLVQDQICNDVRRLIDELPHDQREVILLRHYGGMSFKEIADQTNVSINTALGRMRYALINLRKLINQKNLSLTAI
jgi:RNA polymerase sigma factor (sigma-70 family)